MKSTDFSNFYNMSLHEESPYITKSSEAKGRIKKEEIKKWKKEETKKRKRRRQTKNKKTTKGGKRKTQKGRF